MWLINTLTNNYVNGVSINYVVTTGESFQSGNVPILGGSRTVAITIPFLGYVYFEDIGNKPLGPSRQTWGVLIFYNDNQWVFRYEGNGQLNVIVSADGTLTFNSPSGGDINPIIL